jgi:threonine aldolase
MFCLSKGLSAPVGSMLCGTASFVERARRARKMLGGGMRQAGILAAAGILGLTEMVDRLAEDHAHARALAETLASVPGLSLRPDEVESNFVFFTVLGPDGQPTDPTSFIAAAGRAGVLVSQGDEIRVRVATHYGITAEDVRTAADAFAQVAQQQLAAV